MAKMAAFQPRTDKTYLPKKEILNSQLNSSSWLRSSFSTRASGKVSPLYEKWMKASQEKIRYSKELDLEGKGYHGNIWKEFYVDQEAINNPHTNSYYNSTNDAGLDGKQQGITDLIAKLYPIKLPYVAWIGENNINRYEQQVTKKQKHTIAVNNEQRLQRCDYKLLKFQTNGRMPPINDQGRVISYPTRHKPTRSKTVLNSGLNYYQNYDGVRNNSTTKLHTTFGLQVSNAPLSSRAPSSIKVPLSTKVSSKPSTSSSQKKRDSKERSAAISRESNIIITINGNQPIEE